jgi:hypothetical protein
MHASRFPRCISCMHGESRNEYSVSHSFHKFFVRGTTKMNCTPVLFTGSGTAEFIGFRVPITRYRHSNAHVCERYGSKNKFGTLFEAPLAPGCHPGFLYTRARARTAHGRVYLVEPRIKWPLSHSSTSMAHPPRLLVLRAWLTSSPCADVPVNIDGLSVDKWLG